MTRRVFRPGRVYWEKPPHTLRISSPIEQSNKNNIIYLNFTFIPQQKEVMQREQ